VHCRGTNRCIEAEPRKTVHGLQQLFPGLSTDCLLAQSFNGSDRLNNSWQKGTSRHLGGSLGLAISERSIPEEFVGFCLIKGARLSRGDSREDQQVISLCAGTAGVILFPAQPSP
jgi:hypothetical protein